MFGRDECFTPSPGLSPTSFMEAPSRAGPPSKKPREAPDPHGMAWGESEVPTCWIQNQQRLRGAVWLLLFYKWDET